MSGLHYMPFYIGDYLSNTMHLTTEEHGAYILLIMNYWITAKPIPEDYIPAIIKVDNDRITNVMRTLQHLFNRDEKTKIWHHKRIDQELIKAREKRSKMSSAGKKSAEIRWGDNKRYNECYNEAITNVVTNDVTLAQQSESESKSYRSLNNINKKINKKEKVPRSDNFLKFWNLYPVKTNGKEAQDIFSKKIKNDEMLENVLSALQAQLHEMEFSNQQNVFRAPFPAPHRWLNNERWNDDVNSDEKIKTMPKRHMSFKSPLTTSSIVQGGLDAGQQFYEEQMAREKQIANQNLMLEKPQ